MYNRSAVVLSARFRKTFKQQVKTFAWKDAFISRFETSRVRVNKLVMSSIGFGIAVMIAATRATYLHYEYLKDSYIGKVDIVNLEKVVNSKMWKQYLCKKGKLFYDSRKENTLELDWSGVNIESGDVNYTRVFTPKISLFQNIKKKETDCPHDFIFENNSSHEQTRRIRTTSQFTSSQNIHLTQGFTSSKLQEFSLGAPEAILQISTTFLDGLTLQEKVENLKERRITQSTDDTIRIPSKTEIRVSREDEPIKQEYEFETLLTISGKIKGVFFDKKQQTVYTVTIFMDDIVEGAFPDAIRTKKGVTIPYSGSLKYNIDGKQKTIIYEKKL